MAINWTDGERKQVEDGLTKHGISSGRCAALARIVFRVAKHGDPKTIAIRLRPPKGSLRLAPRPHDPPIPYWFEHVYVETREHAVDAVTGVNGYLPASTYVEAHWEFANMMRIEPVDPATVDPGIQHVDEES